MNETLPSREHFAAYERVRLSGAFNMFDPRARDMAGLDRDDFLAVLKRYDECAEAYADTKQEIADRHGKLNRA